jgi:hypothetical protein
MSEGQDLPRPVFLITDRERLSFTVDEATFYYRRLPPSKRHELLVTHSQRGLYDAQTLAALQLAIATYCLRGWDNVLDANLQPVPFLEEIIPCLPWSVIQRMDELAMESSPEQLRARYQDFLATGSLSSPLARVNPLPVGDVGSN